MPGASQRVRNVTSCHDMLNVWKADPLRVDATVGTAYTVWTGIGAVGALDVGVAILGEPLTGGRALAAALIMAGLSLMKLSTSA